LQKSIIATTGCMDATDLTSTDFG